MSTKGKKSIGNGYYQSGYGKGFKKAPVIWLINGYAYAKDLNGWRNSFSSLSGELHGYVRVNPMKSGNDRIVFYEASLDSEHINYTTFISNLKSSK